PEMILAGRRLNENMAIYVAGEIVKLMTQKRIHVNGARVLMLGATFKENCPDIRNSKVFEAVRELPPRRYDAAVLAVAHREFRELGAEGARRLCRKNHVLYDIKHVFKAN